MTSIVEKIKQKKGLFVLLVIVLLYIFPSLIQVHFTESQEISGFSFGLPGVLSGDEPHYLVVTTSIVNDYDANVGNNYDNAFLYGGCDAGFRFINNTNPAVGRHMFLYNKEKAIVTTLSSEEQADQENMKLLYEKYNVTSFEQLSLRPLGLPLFSAFFVWPLRETCLIETGVIYLGLGVSFIGLFVFYLLVQEIVARFYPEKNNDERKSVGLLFSGILALCTQYWFYSKNYFSEIYLAVFLLVAFYLFIFKRQSFVPGVLLAIGFTMKYPFGMFVALFTIFIVVERQWKRILPFILGIIGPISIIICATWRMVGNPLLLSRSEYLSMFDNYIMGIIVTFFAPDVGLFIAAPVLLFSIIGAWFLYKKNKKFFWYLSLLIIPYTLFWCFLAKTEVGAGGSYSARYLLPIVPFLFMVIMFWYMENKNRTLKWLFWFVTILSFLINLQTAFFYPFFWEKPPWQLIQSITEDPANAWSILKKLFGL